MKRKNIFLISICFLMLITLTGCGNKKVASSSDFKSIAESNDYIVSDVKNQYSAYDSVKEAYVAQHNSEYQLEFYVLDSSDSATQMFNTNKKTFEGYKGSSSSESSSNMGNYSKYALTSSGYYMYLCRVDNTLLYVRVNDSYKDSIKDFVKKLGY